MSGPTFASIISHDPLNTPWTTESRASYCAFAVPTPKPMPSLFGTVAPPVPRPAWMILPSAAAPAPLALPPASAPAPAVATAPAPAPAPAPAVAAEPAVATVAAAESAAVAVQKTAVEQIMTKTKKSSRIPTSKGKKPPFHTYGRANIRPIAGGFLFGDYLATHNAKVGSDLPLTRRVPAMETISNAQVHYMEADIRRSAQMFAASEEAGEAVAMAPASSSVAAIAAGATAAKAQATAAPAAETSTTAPAAAPSAPDLPVYDPTAYCTPPFPAEDQIITLPHYPVPLSATAAGTAPPPPIEAWTAPYAPRYEAVMPQGPMSPFAPGLVPFEPNAIGARLDPRRFKYAPWNAMASVPAAGKKCVRRDNLGPC